MPQTAIGPYTASTAHALRKVMMRDRKQRLASDRWTMIRCRLLRPAGNQDCVLTRLAPEAVAWFHRSHEVTGVWLEPRSFDPLLTEMDRTRVFAALAGRNSIGQRRAVNVAAPQRRPCRAYRRRGGLTSATEFPKVLIERKKFGFVLHIFGPDYNHYLYCNAISNNAQGAVPSAGRSPHSQRSRFESPSGFALRTGKPVISNRLEN